MRELESSLQQFGEFLLKAQLVRETAAPHFVRWVRRFLSRPALDEPVADQVRGFCEELERNGARTGIGGRSARWWMSKGGRVRWRRWSSCERG